MPDLWFYTNTYKQLTNSSIYPLVQTLYSDDKYEIISLEGKAILLRIKDSSDFILWSLWDSEILEINKEIEDGKQEFDVSFRDWDAYVMVGDEEVLIDCYDVDDYSVSVLISKKVWSLAVTYSLLCDGL